MSKSNFKFKLNYSGVRKLLKSEGTKNAVEHYAQEMANECGEGYGASAHMEKTRVVASAATTSYETAKAERDGDGKLLSALKRYDN